MFTYCGELLRSHSIRAGEAFWRSQWWPNGHLIKSDILIFLVNSRRVVTVTAGKFYLMDVQRLRSVIFIVDSVKHPVTANVSISSRLSFQVITQAFSFLTLLQKLAEKNQ